MTTLLMALYALVMVSGIYGLVLQHLMPRLMKERLPAETVFEQIPHIRAQLCVAAEKMRDSFKPAPPAPPKTADAGAPAPSPAKAVTAGSAVMASTKGELSTPTARAKSATGSTVTAEPVAVAAATTTAAPVAKAVEVSPEPAIPSAANAAASASTSETRRNDRHSDGASAKRTAGRSGAARVGAGGRRTCARSSVCSCQCAGGCCSGKIGDGCAGAANAPPKPAAPADQNRPLRLPRNPRPRNPRPRRRNLRPHRTQHRRKRWSNSSIARFFPTSGRDAAKDSAWAMRVSRMTRSDSLNCACPETYRSRVEEIQGWCDERRMLDLQTRLHHWLHGWLFIHVPFSFLLLMLTIWHAYVTLFYY